MKKENLISILITLVVGFILYYIFIPPINIHSLPFLVFLLLMIFTYTIINSLLLLILKKNVKSSYNSLKVFIISLIVVFAYISISDIICSPIFNSKSYSNRITITEGKEFTDTVEEVDFNKLPLLDKDSSSKLGDRTVGSMPDMVSQYYVSDIYTQINYNNEIVRVTPLEYNGFFKWIKNRKEGVTGYIKVNSTTGESTLVKLSKGIKYTESGYFNDYLYRYLRFKYPTYIFDDASFELDEEGNPYFVVPVIKYTAVGLKKDIKGVVVLNPINGESTYYKSSEVPSWVDHVYNADVIISQTDDWGLYQKGYLNSLFSQTGVVETTDGYNYLVMDDDVYLYTGITSVSSDESNIGFIFANLRTKETIFYEVAGAEEFSAMESAEGKVQQMDYDSTFPLLINLNGRPTYLVSLKDDAGLVKMYAFIDVEDYQKVVVTDSSEGIIKAKDNYLNTLDFTSNKTTTEEITINTIKEVIIDGNSYFYITDTLNNKYKVNINVNKDLLPFISNGTKVVISYNNKTSVTNIISIKEV